MNIRNPLNTYLNDIRFKRKLLIAFLCIYLLPMLLLTGWLSINFYNQLLGSTLKDRGSAGVSFANRISERVASMNESLAAIASDKRTNTILSHMDNLEVYSLYDQLHDKDEFVWYVSTLINTSNIHKIVFFMPDAYRFTQKNNFLFPISEVRKNEWYTEYEKNKGDICLSYNSKSVSYSGIGVVDTGLVPVISMIRPLYNPNNMREIKALAVAEIAHSEITAMMSELKGQETLYAADSKGIYLIGGSDVLKDTGIGAIGLEKDWEKVRIQGKGVFYTMWLNIKGTELKLLMAVPVGDVFKVIIRQLIIVLIVIFLSAIFISLVAVYFATKISNRLKILLNKVNKIKDGDLDLKKCDMGKDEIGVLDKNMDYMVQSIKKLLEEQNRLGQEKEMAETRAVKSELLALQSQINPHFLYNTLDLISWQSRFNNMPEMVTLMKALSKFYKASLSRGDDFVGLESELEHVESFISIQNYRYNNSISLIIDKPENVNCKLPKITLQPLVENALIHGILCRADLMGWIRISAVGLNGFVNITVEDNGIGMSLEKLDGLNKRIRSSSSGIGICNVYDRLKIYFGDGASLIFESTPGVGTKAVVKVPDEV